jgi:hypothetical protein
MSAAFPERKTKKLGGIHKQVNNAPIISVLAIRKPCIDQHSWKIMEKGRISISFIVSGYTGIKRAVEI